MSETPIIFAVSDGRAGIERQAVALANAVAQEINAVVIVKQISPAGAQLLLPPQFWPNPLAALPRQQRDLLENLPDIWIGNGRRSIPYSLIARKKGVFVVQLQDPKVPSGMFDAVIAPAHDNVKGENVFETLGGLVWYSKTQIEIAQAKFTNYLNENREKILVILGGNSKTHKFTAQRADAIIANLHELQNPDRIFWITASRRTPAEVSQKFRQFAKENNHAFYENETDGENPFLAWLSLSNIALVTEDSANMLSDCAFFGLPIYLIRLEGGSRKFDVLHNSFFKAGAAREFDGGIEQFEAPKINSVESIAKSIIALWKKQK